MIRVVTPSLSLPAGRQTGTIIADNRLWAMRGWRISPAIGACHYCGMWKPETEAGIELAISEGNLAESHSLDAKALTGDTDGARRNTARDLDRLGGFEIIAAGIELQLRPNSIQHVPDAVLMASRRRALGFAL
jgi:hypothetical protein